MKKLLQHDVIQKRVLFTAWHQTSRCKLKREKSVVMLQYCLLSSGLILFIWKASLSFKSIELLAESRILKHEGEYLLLHKGDVLKCLKICEFLSLSVCSFILVEKWRLVSPI